jgi:hypothetical protein
MEGMKSDEMETLKILGAVNVDVDAPRGVIRWKPVVEFKLQLNKPEMSNDGTIIDR